GQSVSRDAPELPRCCLTTIQSYVSCLAAFLPFTEPAILIAPPNNRSFSVIVVLPASGWAIMAKVLRLATSFANLLMIVIFLIRYSKNRCSYCTLFFGLGRFFGALELPNDRSLVIRK